MRTTFGLRCLLWVVAIMLCPVMIKAQIINGFGGMMLNGSAQLAGSTLRLTEAGVGGVGSAFDTTPLAVDGDTNFNAFFQFAIYDGSGADGFTFTVQNDGAGPGALGGGGGALGYGGISPSVAVEFDTFDNGGKGENAIGINLDGSLISIASAPVTPDMETVRPLFAWVEYASQLDLLEVYFSDVNTQPGAPVVSANVDLSALGSQAFVGFTAATGGLDNTHDIEDFTMFWGEAVPSLPGPMILGLLLMLVLTSVLALRYRHQKSQP